LRAGAAAVVVGMLLSATPVSTFSPGFPLSGIAGASSPSLSLPLRSRSVCGTLRMQEGNGRKVLYGGVGAAMAAAVLLGPVAPVERAVAFSDVGGASPSDVGGAPSFSDVGGAPLGEEGAIHLARTSWIEGNDVLDELVHGGLSGKDEEEGPIAQRKVLSSFMPVGHEEKEKGETPTPRSVVSLSHTLSHSLTLSLSHSLTLALSHSHSRTLELPPGGA